MSKLILIPTDFSPCAANALRYAVQLHKSEKVKLILLHSYSIIYIAADAPADYIFEQREAERENAGLALKKIAGSLKAQNLQIETIVREGLVADTILEVIKEKKPDMVIMGTKGASGIRETIIGSNAAKVIEKAKCPVIAVPEKAKFKPIKNIAVATEYRTSDINMIRDLGMLGKPYKSKLTIVHAVEQGYKPEREESRLHGFEKKLKSRSRYGRYIFKLVADKNPVSAIENYIKKEKPSMIAMSTHPLSFFEKLWGKGITKKVAYHTTIPLIAFHHR